MTIREELKKLVAKLGGTPSKDDQTAELIHKVADNVSGGGGGGASAFTVTFTPTNEEWTAFTADKTIAEIEAAYEEGTIIQGRFGTEDDGYTMLNLESVHGGLASFDDIKIYDSPPTLSYMRLGVYSGGVNCFTYDFELTPAT